MKRLSSDDSAGEARKALNTGWASPAQSTSAAKPEPDAGKPIERQHVDVVVNLLLRLACQVCAQSRFMVFSCMKLKGTWRIKVA